MADIENNNLPEEETKVGEAEKKESAVKDEKGKKPEAKKAVKKNKVPIKQRIVKFFRDYRSEMKKITWCQPKDIVKYTGVVLACIVVVTAFLGILDFSFSKLLMFLGGLY